MKFLPLTAAIGSALTVVALTGEVLPAQAFTFVDTGAGEIEVFDVTGNQIGGGNFTYSPFVGRFVGERVGLKHPLYENPNTPFSAPPTGPTGSTYRPPEGYNLVTSLAMNINIGSSKYSIPGNYQVPTQTGQSIVGSTLFFFKPPSTSELLPNTSNTPNASDVMLTVLGGDPRGGSLFTRPNSWFGCLPACGTGQQQLFALNSNGSWSLSGQGVPSNTSGSFRFSASPNATTAIPEPTTVTGLILVGGFGLWAKRRKQSRKPAPAQRTAV